jgi:hypothetical protein
VTVREWDGFDTLGFFFSPSRVQHSDGEKKSPIFTILKNSWVTNILFRFIAVPRNLLSQSKAG